MNITRSGSMISCERAGTDNERFTPTEVLTNMQQDGSF